jgi:hypothetical protein
MSSPDECWLEFRAIDRAGHMAVFGRLQRLHFLSTSHAQDYFQVVEFGFEFCPSLLPGIVAGFREMVRGTADSNII